MRPSASPPVASWRPPLAACRRAAVLLPFVLVPATVIVGAQPDEPVPIATVRRMPATELPLLTVRGVVTRVGTRQRSCILQDDTDGIYVALDGPDGVVWTGAGKEGGTTAPLEPGHRLEVHGRLEPGGFSPVLTAIRVHVAGRGPLPEPRPADPVQFFHGAFDCTLVEVRGVVQAVLPFGRSWRVTLEAFGRSLVADVAAAAVEGDLRELIDAEVRVVGPTVSIFNTRGEFLMPWVTVNRAGGLTVVAPPPQPAFASPLVPLTTVAGFQPDAVAGHRVRAAGTVIHATPEGRVYLMEGTAGVSVITTGTPGIDPGDRVEVAGFVDRSAPVARIIHALVRRLATGPPPEPLAVAPAAVLAANTAATDSAVKASPGDYEGCLIRFPARLLDATPRTDGGLLSLATDGATVSARAGAADFASLQRIAPGSELLVTGIVEVEWEFKPVVWPPRTPRSLDLVIRSAADVAVVRVPPWWTPGRLAVVLGVGAAVLATTLAWAWSLQREVARQRALAEHELRDRHAAEGTARDRERQAEARLRQELQGKLETSLAAAAVAHEIKLPLSNVLLASRLADDMLAPAGPGVAFIRPVLGDIATEAHRVVETIERMRVLLRNVQTEHVPIDLVDVVHNALLHAAALLQDRRIEVETDGLDASLPIDGDAVQLQNAVVNLLANAADAVADLPPERRRVRVGVRASVAADPGLPPTAEIVVGDAGPGIPDDVLAKVPLHTTKPQGTGLGLFIVRTTAENHGGSMAFGRSPLGGAEVRVRLPCRGAG
jgi:signal transduction histidine kinase